MASKIQPTTTDDVVATAAPSNLPMKAIPGTYGIPFITAIKDRLGFYYGDGGQDKFFESRIEQYNSTVFRINAPPGPFMASDPRVIAVLDAKSFPVLFDVTKVEKRDIFTGTYMPSTSLTGGFRVCAYLDPSEPNHARVKQLLFNLLASRKAQFIPAFTANYSALFDDMESQLSAAKSATSDFNKLNDATALDFIGEAYFGARLSASRAVGTTGPSKAAKWLFLQLCPLITLGLPKFLEDLLLHTFPLPSIIAKSDYKALYAYFNDAAAPIFESAEKLGLSRDEACHNLLFASVFNSYGGLKVFFPGILSSIAKAGPGLHAKLAAEVRSVIGASGGAVTVAAVERMELVRSVVYEALRIDPPVKYQYGRAKQDLVIESHDSAFQVKKGEMIFGYQPLATRDRKVFGSNGGEFVGDRFVGEEGRKLLKYVFWSNGPETESPTVGNKQCPGKDFVVLVGRLLVVEFFQRYDTFTAEVGTQLLGAQLTVTSLTKATGS